MKALLCDLDGTLIDSRADLVNAVNHAREAVGLPVEPSEGILPHVGNGMAKLLEAVLGPLDLPRRDKAEEAFKTYYFKHCLDHTRLYSSVKDELRRLASLFKIAVVTNKPKLFADKILHGLDVAPLFSILVGGDAPLPHKPDPAPLLKACELLHCDPSRAMMIGDGTQDLQAARSAGTKVCLARYGFGYRRELLTSRPDYIIDDFSQLKEILS